MVKGQDEASIDVPEWPREQIELLLRSAATDQLSTDHPSDILDEIEACIAIYRSNKTVATPRLAERRQRIEACGKSLNETIKNLEELDFYLEGTVQYHRALRDCRVLQLVVTNTLAAGISKPGPEPDDRMWLISRLADIFEEHTGTQIQHSFVDLEDRYSGKFFDFMCLCMTPLEPFKSHAALGAAIRDVQAARRQ